jgi:16S rRNA (guanine1207-N2)-methyltransferase
MLFPQSQLLLRNLNDLQGKVLLVEPMADDLAQELSSAGVDFSVYCTDAAVAKVFSRAKACYFAARLEATDKFDTVVLFYPKSKEQLAFTLAELNTVLSADSEIYLVGDNKGGIKSLVAHAAKFGLHAHKLDNAKHCLWFALTGLFEKPLPKQDFGRFKLSAKVGSVSADLEFCSLPGVFNHGKLDSGTALLLQQLGHVQSGKVLDFACGAGIIGALLKLQHPAIELFATDICALATASATATLALHKLPAQVRCQDGLSADLPKFQHIVSNPPFHTGLKTDLSVAELFISQCKQHLQNGGTLTLVANAHLPYAQWLQAAFGNVKELARQQGFVVYHSKFTG